jgi:hypothetical protein
LTARTSARTCCHKPSHVNHMRLGWACGSTVPGPRQDGHPPLRPPAGCSGPREVSWNDRRNDSGQYVRAPDARPALHHLAPTHLAICSSSVPGNRQPHTDHPAFSWSGNHSRTHFSYAREPQRARSRATAEPIGKMIAGRIAKRRDPSRSSSHLPVPSSSFCPQSFCHEVFVRTRQPLTEHPPFFLTSPFRRRIISPSRRRRHVPSPAPHPPTPGRRPRPPGRTRPPEELPAA